MLKNLTVDQLNLIKDAAEQYGIKDYELETKSGSEKGDNYLGVITILKIKDKHSEKVVSTILKTSNNTKYLKNSGDKGSSVFYREAYLYEEVLPLLSKFEEESNISCPFRGTAKYYGSILGAETETILLEDLKSKGYKMWNRKLTMDYNHVAIVFSEYAKFHASSMALSYKQPEVFQKLEPQLEDYLGKKFTDRKIKEMLYKAIYNNYANGVLKEYPKLLEALGKYIEQMHNVFDDLKKERQVITHGDSWCNNMLFNYENDSPKPSKVCFIDWQLSKIGSPIWDLTYFFTVSASKEVLHNYSHYLDIYHKVLSQNLKEFGLDPEEVYSYETFKGHWQKYARCGFWMMIILGKAIVADPDDIPDVSEGISGKTPDMMITLNEEKLKIYTRRFVDVMEYFINEGLLLD